MDSCHCRSERKLVSGTVRYLSGYDRVIQSLIWQVEKPGHGVPTQQLGFIAISTMNQVLTRKRLMKPESVVKAKA